MCMVMLLLTYLMFIDLSKVSHYENEAKSVVLFPLCLSHFQVSSEDSEVRVCYVWLIVIVMFSFSHR